MKRFLAMLIVLVLVCTGSALAEEFALRNGITFGDTMEEVLAKETFAIKTVKDGSDEEETQEDDDEENGTALPYSITTEEGTLAGIPDSYIYYRFNKDKKLMNVDYYFRSSSLKDTIDSDYDSVNDGLVRKYGSTLGYTNGDCYIFTGSALEGAALSAYLFKYLDGYGDLRDYDEWDVNTGDYHVKIEQVEYYWGSSYSEITYSHRMSYTYFTDADLKDAQNEKKEKQDSVDNDL